MPAYTQQNYQQIAALLAAERETNGPSPVLSRIVTAFTTMLARDNPRFSTELFGQAARGQVAATTRPQRKSTGSDRSEGKP